MVLPDGFRYLGHLGEGGQACVVLAEWTHTDDDDDDGQEIVEVVAVKCYERRLLAVDKHRNRVRREVCNLRRLRHPHIVLFRKLGVSQTDLCVVMEFQAGGTLQELLRGSGKLSENTARCYFQQLCLAVEFAHHMGVSNRDIKPANILFRGRGEGYIVLCDFGLSKYEHSIRKPSMVGTRGYGAPELLLPTGRTWSKKDLQMADAYSSGVTLYQMLFGVDHWPQLGRIRPGADHNYVEVLKSLMGDEKHPIHYPEVDPPISQACLDLLTSLLQPNPKLRSSISNVLHSTWFTEKLPEGFLNYNILLLDAHNNGDVGNDHLPCEADLRQCIDEAGGVASR